MKTQEVKKTETAQKHRGNTLTRGVEFACDGEILRTALG